ncbi:prepilin peptidase [Candidatus Microgenomates bacterium]|nr:prepilin peptidase [Candidatus Microgenomates bacterium]
MAGLIFFLLGLVIGSFLSSLTYEVAKPKFSWKNLWRRSACPKCHQQISWYDNIPLLSYAILHGRCRQCHKKISLRYPLLEITTGVVFLLIGLKFWDDGWYLGIMLLTATLLIAIAVVDIEKMIIPDVLLFPLLTLNLIFLILFAPSAISINFFWASMSALFLLLVNWVTLGRGMGLGDVKLAFAMGLILGVNTYLAFFVAFISGAMVGLALVAVKRAHFGKPIPFGPFLIIGTILTMLFGGEISKLVGL